MADYHPLIARAVAGLEKNTGEARRTLYERARTALVAQLRGVVPALEESEITRERLALEEAIRKVEADSARHAREAARPTVARRLDIPRRDESALPVRDEIPRPPPRSEPPPRPAPSWQPPPPPRDEERRPPRPEPPDTLPPAEPRPPERHDMGFSAPAPAEPTAPDPRSLAELDSLEPQLQSENLWALPLDGAMTDAASAPPQRHTPPQVAEEEEQPAPLPRRPRSTAGLIRTLIILLLLAVLGGLGYWQWPTIQGVATGLYALVLPSGAQRPAPAEQARPKITDRIGQPAPQPGTTVARVVLYEEDPDDPQGKRFIGTVNWKTEMKSVTPGRSPEMVVRADLDIPERKMGVTWTLRRNTDPSLPASHTIEIVFNLPPDSPTGGVAKVPGVLMKQSEQTRGVPLAGVAAEMPPAYFLIGLSSVETDVGRNVQLLKERSWFDIPIVYKNNRRAILAMEKGAQGEKAFGEAFGAWRQ